MSKKSWGSPFISILRKLNVKIDKQTEALIETEKARSPEMTTIDIVQRLAIAPPETINKAVAIAKAAGNGEALADCIQTARASVAETRKASVTLSRLASGIAKKA
jgi:hypothetical protein